MQKIDRNQKEIAANEIMPKKSILKNEIVKSIMFSIVASISVIVISLSIQMHRAHVAVVKVFLFKIWR